MERVIGTVTGILENSFVNVKLDRKSMCGESCAACGGLCGLHDSVIRAKNGVNAKRGDSVTVEIPTLKGMHAMLIAYGIPLLYMLVIAVLMAVVLPEKLGACLLIAGVALWFMTLHFLEKKDIFSKQFEACVISIEEDKDETV